MMHAYRHDDLETLNAEVVVIGAGPAGIAAAATAAARGRGVVVLDHGLESGGQIWRHRAGARVPRAAAQWLARLVRSGATIVHGAAVFDARPTRNAKTFEVLAEREGRALRVQAASVVLATGARERFIPFDGWTLPGVIGIGGAQALLKSGASFRGKRVIIAGSGPLLLPVAAALTHDGARIALVAEQARRGAVVRFGAGLWRSPAMIAQAARYRARFAFTPYRTGTWVAAAHGTDALESVTVTDGVRSWRERADVLCTGYGLVPNIELARLLGCEIRASAVVVDVTQGTTVSGVYAVGEACGIGGAPLSLIEGEIAGIAVARGRSSLESLVARRATLQRTAQRMHDAFALRSELRALSHSDTIVCRCESVTHDAVSSACSARQAKLYTRAGMGACQGRVCGPALEFLFGWPPDTVRAPTEPTLVSVLCSDVAESADVSDSHFSA